MEFKTIENWMLIDLPAERNWRLKRCCTWSNIVWSRCISRLMIETIQICSSPNLKKVNDEQVESLLEMSDASQIKLNSLSFHDTQRIYSIVNFELRALCCFWVDWNSICMLRNSALIKYQTEREFEIRAQFDWCLHLLNALLNVKLVPVKCACVCVCVLQRF